MKFFWIIQVGPKSSDKCPYGREAEREKRKYRHMETEEEEVM
jgi:hypothetical protein